MRSVRLVEPGDGDAPDHQGALVVATDDGENFELVVDEALLAALAPDGPGSTDPDETDPEETPAVTSARTTPTGPPLSPREIQVRVRSGESPEDLAADSETPLDKIMRFAFPVMEERIRIGDEARRARARRDGDGALVPFGETVDRRFVAHGIDPSSVGWDSFRRPDGTWVVIASWRTGDHERHAHWAFSLAARTVLPADEVGSDLLSDRPLRPVVRVVPDHDENAELVDEVYDQEAPPPYSNQPYQAPPPVRPVPPPYSVSRQTGPEHRTPTPPSRPSGETHDSPPLPLRLAEPLHPRPTAVPNPPEEPQEGEAVTGSIAFDELFDANIVPPDEPIARPTEDGLPGSPKRPTRKAAREQTKIPSWDDILLGVRRKQD